MRGQAAEGLAQLRQGMAAVLATGHTIARPSHLVLLAEVTGFAGQVEDGLRLLAEAHRLQGEFLLRQATPDTAHAEAYFQQTLAVGRRQQAKS